MTLSMTTKELTAEVERLEAEAKGRAISLGGSTGPWADMDAKLFYTLGAALRELSRRLTESESRPVLTDEVVGLARKVKRAIHHDRESPMVWQHSGALATAILTLSAKDERGKGPDWKPNMDHIDIVVGPDVQPPPSPAGVTREEVDDAVWSIRATANHADLLTRLLARAETAEAERDAAVKAAKHATERAEMAEKDKAHTAEKSQHWYAECGRVAYELRQAEASALRFKDEAAEHAGLSDQLKSRISALEAELAAAKEAGRTGYPSERAGR